MTIRDSVENHPLWFAGTLLIAGFLAGISVYGFFKGAPNLTPDSASWSEEARNAGWIPKGDCAAYPVNLTISAPGDGATVPVNNFSSENSNLRTTIVIQTSRPLPEKNSIGYIWNEKDSPNYYVSFSDLASDDVRKVFREDRYIPLPLKLTDTSVSITLRALITDNPQKFGATYSSIDQIRASDPNVIISNPVTVTPRPE